MKQIITIIAICSAIFVFEQAAFAFQGFGTPNRPTVTPYLNLVPGRNRSAALNYYRSYRPEIEFRRNEQLLGRSIRTLQNEINQPQLTEQKANSQLGTTGHPTVFGNTGSYFPGGPQRRR
ncbi:MAG TPA: hypothetical protein VMM56_11455 [Planctomycetaceae bacterium]|nr:hypothetical protein [Planctomycetaceae bacterium]